MVKERNFVLRSNPCFLGQYLCWITHLFVFGIGTVSTISFFVILVRICFLDIKAYENHDAPMFPENVTTLISGLDHSDQSQTI